MAGVISVAEGKVRKMRESDEQPGAPSSGSAEERRAHPRFPTRFRVHCRRLGRGGIDQGVEVVDLSVGGLRISSPAAMQTGDVVELTVAEGSDPFVVTGLVVGTSPEGDDRYSNIAFTRVGPATLDNVTQLVARMSTA